VFYKSYAFVKRNKNKKMKILFKIIILLICFLNGNAQTCFTLSEIASLFEKQSSQIKNLQKGFYIKKLFFLNNASQWKWQSKISAEMPYNKSIESVVKGDGTITYVQREFINPELGLTTSRKLLHTGGEIGMRNNIGLLNNLAINDKQFNSNWINIFASQPLFAFNESKANYKKAIVEMSIDSIAIYKQQKVKLKEFMQVVLDMQLLQEKAFVLEQNIVVINKQKSISTLLLASGRVLPSDTLQISNELEKALLEQKQNIDISALKQNYMQQVLGNVGVFTICNFVTIDILQMDITELQASYERNNFAKELILDSFIAKQNAEKSKKAYGITTNINAGIGINKNANTAQGVFNSPSQRQNISISTSVPLSNWGNYYRGVEISKIENEIFEQNKIDIHNKANLWSKEQVNTYYYLIKNYKLAKQNIIVAEELIRVAQLKYSAGKITFIDLNKLLQEKRNLEYTILEQISKIHLFRYQLKVDTLLDL
jgi:Outer membrane efflux protein